MANPLTETQITDIMKDMLPRLAPTRKQVREVCQVLNQVKKIEYDRLLTETKLPGVIVQEVIKSMSTLNFISSEVIGNNMVITMLQPFLTERYVVQLGWALYCSCVREHRTKNTQDAMLHPVANEHGVVSRLECQNCGALYALNKSQGRM